MPCARLCVDLGQVRGSDETGLSGMQPDGIPDVLNPAERGDGRVCSAGQSGEEDCDEWVKAA
ncbi:hypothetical protein JNB_06679 [Janibacter sp. HTCC2649]|nr:hypothetical protein JNB_06679 [Janibacter sp. HTCC2649]